MSTLKDVGDVDEYTEVGASIQNTVIIVNFLPAITINID